MKSTLTYFSTFFITLFVSAFIAMQYAPTAGPKKFSLPPLDKVFIGYYGDKDAIHRIIYHGLFGFGQRMNEADILIMGTSHAELGFSAEQISKTFSAQMGRPIKAVNLGLGWSEGFAFQKYVVEKNNLQCKVMLMDLYSPLADKLSQPAKEIISESLMTSYSRVVETWATTAKDWLFDGIFPRITYVDGKFVVQRFLKYFVGFRNWTDGDVWDFWFPTYGEVYRNTPTTMVTYPILAISQTKENAAEFARLVSLAALQARHLYIFTTLMPSNSLNLDAYVTPAHQLGLPFIQISAAGLELLDKEHTNANGRSVATASLIAAWRDYPAAMHALQQCHPNRS